MADRDVKGNQVQRMLAGMDAGKGSVIATGLAKIGGGGNVAGTDPDTRQLEKIGRLLEQIRDQARKNVDREME
jgi:hypothetical protein